VDYEGNVNMQYTKTNMIEDSELRKETDPCQYRLDSDNKKYKELLQEIPKGHLLVDFEPLDKGLCFFDDGKRFFVSVFNITVLPRFQALLYLVRRHGIKKGVNIYKKVMEVNDFDIELLRRLARGTLKC
jgi:hypothetical protein